MKIQTILQYEKWINVFNILSLEIDNRETEKN